MTRTDSLNASIDAAELVLGYAAARGIPVPPRDIQAIIKVIRPSENGTHQVANGDEGEFWAAFGRLTKAVSPVTVESLRALHAQVTVRLPFGSPHSIPLADEAVRRYRRWAILAVSALLLIQSYSFVGSTLLDGIKDLREKATAVAAKRAERIAELESLNRAVPGDVKIVSLDARALTVRQELRASFAVLEGWNALWQAGLRLPLCLITPVFHLEAWLRGQIGLCGPPASADESLAVARAGVVLHAVKSFCLPLLFGWVGACAFILRRLGNEIGGLTYSALSETAYRLRMPLGALAGMAIGLFLVPPESSPGVTGTSPTLALTSLSAGGLAFLAGYSVELLFAIMDAIISAFSSASSNRTSG
jgi:hypothetical protein